MPDIPVPEAEPTAQTIPVPTEVTVPCTTEVAATTLPFVAEVTAAVTNILSAHPDGSTVTLSRLMDCAVGAAWLPEPEFTQFKRAVKKDPRLSRMGRGILQVMPTAEGSGVEGDNETQVVRRVVEDSRMLPVKPVQVLREEDLADFVDTAVTRLLEERDQFGVGAVARMVSRRVGFELSRENKARIRVMIARRADVELGDDGIWRPKGGIVFTSERIVRVDSLGEMIKIWHRESSANGADRGRRYSRNHVHFKRGADMNNWHPEDFAD